MINETKYRGKEESTLSKNNESFDYYNHFLWKESPSNIKENLSGALAILASDQELIKKITCNSWDNDNNIFLIGQLWQKKKKRGLLGNRESKKMERIEKQKLKTTEELRENYCAVCSNKEIKELENLKKRLIKKENKNSYERDKDYFDTQKNKKDAYNQGDKKLKNSMKKFQLDNILFNHIFEHVIRDLVEDIIKEKNIKEGIKIVKTNEYDDVHSNTDYIIEFDLGKQKEAFRMIDITTISNEDKIYQKEQKNEKPILFDYSTKKGKTVKEIKKKDVWSIDKNFSFNLVNNYVDLIKKGEKISSGKCLELAKKVGEASVTNISNKISSSINDVLKN